MKLTKRQTDEINKIIAEEAQVFLQARSRTNSQISDNLINEQVRKLMNEGAVDAVSVVGNDIEALVGKLADHWHTENDGVASVDPNQWESHVERAVAEVHAKINEILYDVEMRLLDGGFASDDDLSKWDEGHPEGNDFERF